MKHFRQWLSQALLPCAIATPEQEMSNFFAKYFSGQENIDAVSYFSNVHQVEICTGELHQFLKTYGTYLIDNPSCLSVHMEAVMEIAVGKKLYEEPPTSKILEDLRDYALYTFLPFPCHTQFVESGVKEAAIVSETGREEQTRTNLAILRSRSIEPFLENARNAMEHAVENEDKKMVPKGWKRNRSILTGAKRQHLEIKELIAAGGNVDLTAFSLSREEQYKLKRRKTTVEKVINSQHRQDNAAERTRGITITSLGKGLIKYTLPKSDNIELLRTELRLRSVIFAPETNISTLRNLILEDEGERYNHEHDTTRKSFKPMDISIYQHLLA